MNRKEKIEEILLTDFGCFDDFTVDKILDLFAVSDSLLADFLKYAVDDTMRISGCIDGLAGTTFVGDTYEKIAADYNVVRQSEQLVCSCGHKKIKTDSECECGNAKCNL